MFKKLKTSEIQIILYMYFIYFYIVSYHYSYYASLSINETDGADKLVDKQYKTA